MSLWSAFQGHILIFLLNQVGSRWDQVADIVRLGEEMKLTCIQAIKMDALKSVQVEMSRPEASQVNQGNLLAVDTTDMASDISRSGNLDKNLDSIAAHHQNLEGAHEPVDAGNNGLIITFLDVGLVKLEDYSIIFCFHHQEPLVSHY